MDDMSRMLIEHQCERLVRLYANLIDAYDYDGFLRLWAEDGEWIVFGKSMRGHAEIRTALGARERNAVFRHLVTNVVIDATSVDRASGVCYTLAFHASNCPSLPARMATPRYIVDYRDAFVRHPERGWLFSRREVIAVMARGD